jgi:hypothetical protein
MIIMRTDSKQELPDKAFALETIYGGVRFRSRLEARWAVYFDLIGLPWIYEPEGYGLKSGNYCPDFVTNFSYSNSNFFLEVKPNDQAFVPISKKLRDFSDAVNTVIYCLSGFPTIDPQFGILPQSEHGIYGCFCHYAFTRKGWMQPYYCGGEGIRAWCEEDYYTVASNFRFENGRADRVRITT